MKRHGKNYSIDDQIRNLDLKTSRRDTESKRYTKTKSGRPVVVSSSSRLSFSSDSSSSRDFSPKTPPSKSIVKMPPAPKRPKRTNQHTYTNRPVEKSKRAVFQQVNIPLSVSHINRSDIMSFAASNRLKNHGPSPLNNKSALKTVAEDAMIYVKQKKQTDATSAVSKRARRKAVTRAQQRVTKPKQP